MHVSAETAQQEKEAEKRLEWMWGDVGMLPLLGPALARANPNRWSSGSAENTACELEWQTEARPVRLRVVGHSYTHTFETPEGAAAWIRSCSATEQHEQQLNSTLAMTGGLVGLVASPALALFCRLNTKIAWPANNIFSSGLYAHEAVGRPYRCEINNAGVLNPSLSLPPPPLSLSACGRGRLAKFQTTPGSHPRLAISWDDFSGTTDQQACAFIEAVSSGTQSITVGGDSWTLEVEGSGFWSAYSCGNKYVIACRGGDGGKADACGHPGSPARAYVQGVPVTEYPTEAVPLQLCRELSQKGQLSVVGYSQGGTTALGCLAGAGACTCTCSSPRPFCGVV